MATIQAKGIACLVVVPFKSFFIFRAVTLAWAMSLIRILGAKE